jgi:transglutaminase-like putative cysteine protease
VSIAVSTSAPRPAAAWLMVSLASATLWITLQIAPWVIAIQVLAFAGSYLRRERPFAWQHSALVLDAALAGIVGLTLVLLWGAAPATIALGHFAALTQGLQLMDARPRRSEFLLVTLAVFQVILAANLTDSVFFIPLLVATLLATVWTLMVHTLRMEAIEAASPQSLSRAITPGLMRTTLVASSLAMALALVLFLVLPRLRSSVVSGRVHAPTYATAGFSETVLLGTLGRIRQDATVVLRVETLEGEAPGPGQAYWRGLAFDRFDGRSWSITPPGRHLVAGSAESGLSFGRDPDSANLLQRIVREPVQGGVLFLAGEVQRLQGSVPRLQRDTSGGFYAIHQQDKRVRYTVASRVRPTRDSGLANDPARSPTRLGSRYLQRPMPRATPPGLARRITSGAHSDAERMHALENHLLTRGRYTDTPPDLAGEDGPSPILAFLEGELAGHCEYFASALVLLARDLEIPARLVNGFAGGRENRIGDFLELTRSDAHTWVEVHYANAGWVRYDPTPPDLRRRAALPLSLSIHLRDLASAVELWWFQRVVGFDRSDQMFAIQRAWLAWKGAQPGRSGVREEGQRSGAARGAEITGPWREATASLALLAAAGLAARRLRRWRARPPVHPAYGEALRTLARRKLVRGPAVTPRDFARQVAGELPDAPASAFAALTERYLAERFGGRPWTGAAGDLRGFRQSLRGARRR